MSDWTQQEIETLVRSRADGLTLRQCGERLGRSWNACNQKWARIKGKKSNYERVQKKRANRLLSDADIERIRRLLNTYSRQDVAAIIGCAPQTIGALKRRGWKSIRGSAIRSRPPDFALYANEMTVRELMKRYSAGSGAVRRWIAELGNRNFVGRKGGVTPRNIPADFTSVYMHLSVPELCARFSVRPGTIRRWRDKCGLPVKWSEKQNKIYKLRRSVNDNGPGWAERYIERKRGASQ